PHIIFLGSGPAKPMLEEMATKRELTNVEFHDHVPSEVAAKYIQAADAMLVHLKPMAGGDFSVPHRLFSYMLSGKVIIAAAEGDTAELVRSNACGWVCPPG